MYGKGGLEGSIRRVHYHVIGKRDWASGEYIFLVLLVCIGPV